MAEEGRYAFFRGENSLQGAPESSGEQDQAAAAAPADGAGEADKALRRNLFNLNRDNQSLQQEFYRELLENERSGVQAQEAY